MVMIFDEPITLTFPHGKDDYKKIEVVDKGGKYDLYRISPSVAHWPAADVPDEVNPRSHPQDSLIGKVAADIEETLRDNPEDFWLANRGGFLLAERVDYDDETSMLSIRLSEPKLHGLADGATTNAVISKLQSRCGMTGIVVGLTDHDRIGKLVQGRNRSVQVKEWSLADFRGGFQWLKDEVERPGGKLRGRIGWEENAQKDVSVLELISVLTLFHPYYEGSNGKRAPTAAFSSKGTADKRFLDEKMQPGYRALAPVIDEIAELHDHIQCKFEAAYAAYGKNNNKKKHQLGKRKGTEKKSVKLPFTQVSCEYKIDKGLIFPLLAAHRCLLSFDKDQAAWKTDPFDFFDNYGPEIVGRLYDEYEKLRNNPASVGKNASVYQGLYEKAQNLFITRLPVAAE
jgi:hypothetical protein